MNIGHALRDLRRRKNVTQAELASRADVSQAYLSQVENNRKDATLTTLERVSEALGVPLAVLFFLAMEERDVAAAKREAYAVLAPPLRHLVDAAVSADEGETGHA